MALSDDLISYWSLDDATDAHGSNDLTNNGSATFVSGKVGDAVDLESGSSQYLSRADNASLSTGDIDFTLAAWVNLESKGAKRTIAARDNVDFEYFFSYTNAFDRFRFEVYSGTGSVTLNADDFGSPSTGTWYFVVAWHDSVNNLVGISVNAGTADTTSYSDGVRDSGSEFRLGNNSFSELWDGQLDEFGFWKRVLSGAERTELYNAGAGRDYAYVAGSPPAAVIVHEITPTGVSGSSRWELRS